MLWLYPKGLDTTLSNDFTLGAFHCPCGDKTCTHTLVHPRLVLALQTLRMMLGRPLALAAGFHCKPWHRLAGGRPRSYHTRGMAADIRCGSLEEVAELAGAAQQVRQIGGVGRYPARLTVHLDVRPRPRGGAVCWME
ncbi:MAG: D-Ala-D-Ala carboxypeptidase family metallohydrolase [Deltaproteobacteria bacterium]|nr:D-Ala-D-Ala carboxypeptidase family metallohydrolase [Deltaproteobacteria bacterium]